MILNYPDVDIFKKYQRDRNDGKFVMLYPGSLNWHQGIDLAIRAFSLIAQEYPFAEFQIYGDGSEKKALMSLAQDLNLENRVLFKGIVPLEDIAKIMANSDLGVVPKRAVSFGNEAFSTKIFEFMVMGVPVLASSTKIDRYYFDEKQIMFFESENVDDLAGKMALLIRDSELRTQLVAKSDRYIQSNTWCVRSNEYLHVIDKIGVTNRA